MARSMGIIFAIGARVQSTVAAAFGSVGARIQTLRADLRSFEAINRNAERLSTANATLQQRRAAFRADPSEAMRRELERAQREFRSASRAAREYGVNIRNMAERQAAARDAIRRTTEALARQRQLQANAARRQELGSGILGTVAMAAGVVVPIKAAIDFESAFADVSKVVSFADAAEVRTVQGDIKALSAQTGLAASGIAGIYAAAGEAKLATTRQELKSFADTAATMAVAFGVSAEDAGAKMASWRSKMNLTQAEVVSMADAMNHLGNNMAANAADTATVVERMGAVAKGAGLSAQAIAALSATFVAASPSPEIAATGMKNFLLALTRGEAMTGSQKTALAKIGFGDPKALAASMQADAETTLLMVMQGLSKVNKAEHGAVLSSLFGTESIGAIAPLLENLDLLKNSFSLVADKQKFAGSMAAEYATRSNTTEHAISRSVRSLDALAITIGTAVLPAVAKAAETFTALLAPVIGLAQEYPQVTAAAFGVVGALVGLKVAVLAGGYAFTIFSDGLVMARRAITAVTVAARAMSVALLANPIGLVVIGVVALTAGLVWLYRNCEPVRNVMNSIWSVIKIIGAGVITVMVMPFVLAWQQIKAAWGPAKTFFGVIWSGITSGGKAVWNGITAAASWAWGGIKAIWAPVGAFFGTIWDGISTGGTAVWGVIGGTLGGIWDYVKVPALDFFNWMAEKFSWLTDSIQAVSGTYESVKGSVVGTFETIKSWNPFADDEDEPEAAAAVPAPKAPGQTVVTAPVAIATQARAVAQPLSVASTHNIQPPTSAPPAGFPASIPQMTQIQAPVTQEINVTMNGIPEQEFADRVLAALRANASHLEQLVGKAVSGALSREKRVAYGS